MGCTWWSATEFSPPRYIMHTRFKPSLVALRFLPTPETPCARALPYRPHLPGIPSRGYPQSGDPNGTPPNVTSPDGTFRWDLRHACSPPCASSQPLKPPAPGPSSSVPTSTGAALNAPEMPRASYWPVPTLDTPRRIYPGNLFPAPVILNHENNDINILDNNIVKSYITIRLRIVFNQP
jgi:hypothetical protein